MKKIFCFFLISFSFWQLNAQRIDTTITRELHSKITGQHYELFISLPSSYKAKDTTRYPVVYVLDGNFMFRVMQTTYSALRDVETVNEMIIVGIGYKGVTNVIQSMEKRTPDYTPTKDTTFERMMRDYQINVRTGEAGRFLMALKTEIMPLIERSYRTKEKGLAGHSFGALFGAYVLLREPSLFEKYILSSTSLEWHNFALLQQEADFYAAGNHTIKAQVLITVGADEEKDRMIDPMRKLTASLREHQYKELQVEERVLNYEDHNSAYLAAFSQGLKLLYKKPVPAAR